MPTYLSHTSALNHLRSPRVAAWSRTAQLPAAQPTRPIAHTVGTIEETTIEELALLESARFAHLAKPIHLLAPHAEDRLRRKGFVWHTCTLSLPKGSFLRVAESTFSSSPELLICQAASNLSFPKLLALGCELSGTYRVSDADPRGFLDAGPVLTARSLERFLQRADGVHGAKAARRVLLYLVEGSASPMETIVVLLLCLPRRMGGYGLPVPQMNGRIDVGKRARKAATKNYYKCDLLWPEANLAVEYESDLCHTGSNDIANDSARRSALAYLGVEVVTLTKRQVVNMTELDRVAILLSKRLLPREPVASAAWRTKRNKLHRELLDFSRS